MTYWAREHEQNLRTIGDMIRDLDTIYEETIPTLIRELNEDDAEACAHAVAWLAGARQGLGRTMGRLDEARKALPEPKVPRIGEGTIGHAPPGRGGDIGEQDSLSPLAAVPPSLSEQPTATDVMERDG